MNRHSKKEPKSHKKSLAQGGLKNKVSILGNRKKFNANGTPARDPLDPVNALRDQINSDPDLKNLLQISLAAANEAGKELDQILYEALTWPANTDEYLKFLEEFAKWIPQQSGEEAFRSPDNPDNYQEVYVRLCHFYFLIDQPVSVDGNQVLAQLDPWFREWLVVYADYWGTFLDTPASFNDMVLESFRTYAPLYRVEDSMIENYQQLVPNNPSGWQTFNQFFARSLNSGLRPIYSPGDNTYVTAAADCTFMETFSIDADSNVISDQRVTAKMTHSIGNISDLLQDSPYKDQFANGTFVHYFLNTFSYHRFHAPVAGILRECRPIQGLVYLNVIINNGRFDAPDSSEDGYEFNQSRGLTVWDTKDSPAGNIGLVAALPVGMAQVSSCIMTGTVDKQFQKGEEFGYFQFGGSDMILLFQAGAVEYLIATSQTAYLHFGEQVAKCKTPGS